MALTCSLLGHDFDDYEVVREREERGSEVVTSVREVAVCERCGTERVLSENTEVTSIVDPTDVDADAVTANGREGDDPVTADDAPDSPTAEGTTDVAPDETVAEATPGPDPDAAPGPDAAPETGTEAPAPEAPDSPTDDGAELVESEATDDVGGLDATDADPAEAPPERTAGAAADADEGAETDDRDPEGSVDDDDAVILTDAPEEREYGEWPSHDGQRYQPWDPDRLLDDPDATEDDGPTVAEMMGEEPTDGSARTGDAGDDDAPRTDDAGPEFEETEAVRDATTFRCPECGFETAAGAVSLRRGDACPSCHRGYLVAERNP